jgi:hypothetical protein
MIGMLEQVHYFDVYVPDGDTWVKSNVASSPLVGRFCHNSLNYQMQIMNIRERAEMLAGRRLQYPPLYDMPDNARVYWLNDPTAGGGVTVWNVQEGTESAWHGMDGVVVVNTCQINRIDNIE